MSKTNHNIETEPVDEDERKRLAEETRSNLDGNGERTDRDDEEGDP